VPGWPRDNAGERLASRREFLGFINFVVFGFTGCEAGIVASLTVV